MAYIYPFRGQWPDIDPGAYLADNVTVVGKVTIKKEQTCGLASSSAAMITKLSSVKASIYRTIR